MVRKAMLIVDDYKDELLGMGASRSQRKIQAN